MRPAVAFLLFSAVLSGFILGQLTPLNTSNNKTFYSTITETVTTTSLSTTTATVKTYLTSAVTTTVVRRTTETVSQLVPPSDLRVQAADFRQIVLSWRDNSVGEDGFVIERSEDGKVFSAIGRTAPNAISFADASVEREKTYLYRVRAFRGSVVSNASNTVVETATPYGIPLSNYFGGLGEVETGITNAANMREGFADIFNPYWNWQPWPSGSKGASVEASIDFQEYVSGAGSQKITIKRDNESGPETRLILSSYVVRSKNPRYSVFYPLPGDKVVFSFQVKTGEKISNIQYEVMLYFIVRDNTGNERYLSPLYVLRSGNSTPFWTKISFTAEAPANLTAARVLIVFTCVRSCMGTFWLDDFVLRTEPEKRLPLVGRVGNNFKLAAIHGTVVMTEPLELAQKYDLLLGGGYYNTYVKGINPQVVSLYYFNDPSLVVSVRNSSNTPPCMLRWNGSKPVYEFRPYRTIYKKVFSEWFLSSASSSKYPREDGSGYYIVREKYCEFLLDIGRKDVVDAALKGIEKLHAYAGYNNPLLSPILFHDNLPNFIYLWNMDGMPPSKYPDRSVRKTVLENMLSRLKSELIDTGPERKIIANIGTYRDERFELLLRFDYDGVFIEYFTQIFNRTHDAQLLYRQFQVLNAYPEDRFVILVDVVPAGYVEQWNQDPRLVPEDVRRRFNFVIASLYLVNKPKTYVALRGGEGEYTTPSYILKDFYIPVGSPLTGIEVVEGDERGALFIRRYSNGIVLLNTANGRTFTYFLAERHRDRAGNVFDGLIAIPPQTGFVLYRDVSQRSAVASTDFPNPPFSTFVHYMHMLGMFYIAAELLFITKLLDSVKDAYDAGGFVNAMTYPTKPITRKMKSATSRATSLTASSGLRKPINPAHHAV
ncbi:MAG: fibronectin type III domain-containing protein [Candidatus Caldarchaeum sp.]|uniref:Fibronectin type III domain-containing protein n=1 Tax=Caldiarchaeum subterraneum TaxID=311458 RepID=A0A7C5LD56_CALS0